MNLDKEVIDTIRRVSRSLAPKFRFGFYDAEDIEQECFIIAIDALKNFDPKQGSLTTFLYIHISNRLKNFLRKHYYRQTFSCSICGGNDPDCESCERRRWRFIVKKHLLEPISIDRVDCDNEKNAYFSNDPLEKMALDEIFSIINSNLEIELRVDYLKMLEGLHIQKTRRLFIEARIIEILEKHNIL